MTVAAGKVGNRKKRHKASGSMVASAQAILREEAGAILELAEQLCETSFVRAVSLILACRGHVAVIGMGKAGLIGHKIAATLASTGTPSYFLHPSEALHGDLGRLGRQDLVLALSASGETPETVRTAHFARDNGLKVIAMTARGESSLARAATSVLLLRGADEAGTLRLAPSASTTCLLALGDALALVASERKGFHADDFARLHPGGTLGLKLAPVETVMRGLNQCRVACLNATTREVLVGAGRPGRRCGAIMLVDEHGRLRGIFTDSDLARLIEGRRDEALDRPITQAMTPEPRTIAAGRRLEDAVRLLMEYKLSELPVVDADGRPLGLIDITDVLPLLPADPLPDLMR